MSSGDSSNRGEAEAGASRSRSEKRVEDAHHVFGADTTTSVGHFNYRFFGNVRTFTFNSSNLNCDLAFAFDGFNRIDDQIEYGIFDESRVDGESERICGRLENQIDITTRGSGACQLSA